jgi:hypothetical protein
MKKILRTLLNSAKTSTEGKSKTDLVLGTILGLILFFGCVTFFPLLLIWGLKMIGLPVVANLKTWFGSVLIMVYMIVIRKVGTNDQADQKPQQ